MREMHWSWEDLQGTPPYVKRFCNDLTAIRRRIHAEAAERAQRQQARGLR
jgi:hypothetical protein